MVPPRPAGPPPRPAADGPLKGERVAIVSEAVDGPLAHAVAALGMVVVSSIHVRTTVVAVADGEPFGRAVRACAVFRTAEDAKRAGQCLMILPRGELVEAGHNDRGRA